MPWFWTMMPNSPHAHRKRDEVRKLVKEVGGRLAEDELFFSQGAPTACALIEVPDEKAAKALAEKLRAHELHALFSTDEMQDVDRIGEGLNRPRDAAE